MAHQVSVRSAVFESLHSILSADKADRESGEEKLKVLEITEGVLLNTQYIDIVYITMFCTLFSRILKNSLRLRPES